MNQARNWLFLALFALMSLQMLLALVHIRSYQRAVKNLRGSGILGIGQRKGGLKRGEILILSYNRENDRVVVCQSMRGYTIFAKFMEIPSYAGLSLSDIRLIGEELDAQEFKRYRKRHPYDPNVLSKKKGALIQAVEAIELRLKREAASDIDERKSAVATPAI